MLGDEREAAPGIGLLRAVPLDEQGAKVDACLGGVLGVRSSPGLATRPQEDLHAAARIGVDADASGERDPEPVAALEIFAAGLV